MKRFFYVFFISASLISLQGMEISRMRQLVSCLDKSRKMLVLCDIDNTLVQPVTDLGSDQWLSYKLHRYTSKGYSLSDAYAKLLPLYFHINYQITLVPTEPDIHHELATLKTMTDKVICLTARSPNLAPKTIAELIKNRLEFNFDGIETSFPLHTKHASLYQEGIIFCGANNKAEVLQSFLDKIDYCPDVIVFVDDKQSNIDGLATFSKQAGIEFIGVRYAGCDQRVARFDYSQTKQELKQFLLEYPFTRN